jgi:hypothetical protein
MKVKVKFTELDKQVQELWLHEVHMNYHHFKV